MMMILLKSKIRIFMAALLATAFSLALPVTATAQKKMCLAANEPVGTARGIFLGRVAWAHAPGAAQWDGTATCHWYSDECNDQKACDWMVAKTVCSLSGYEDETDAWDGIFRYFNKTHGKGDCGYSNGERIVVKINNNNTYSHDDCDEINASPQMVLALLVSLVEKAGVPQECITVAEPSRFITDYLFNKCHGRYPKVRYVDNMGGDGRVKSEYDSDVMAYSKDNGQLARGIERSFTEADYVINMALLKGHNGQGVTLCGKNWYGAMSIHSDWRKNFHNNFNQSRDGKPKYVTFVDFMGHKDLGGKGLLFLIDGLYGCRLVNGKPSPKWDVAPFDGEWPCSLLGSLDPVAVDMVGIDLMTAQFPDLPDADYADMYLVEAAMADNAPSGTVYDPEGDGTTLNSLGTAEHWNNASERKYSRNMGKDNGIELVYVKK